MDKSDTPFVIKAYSKKELALRYFPTSTHAAAVCHLKAWLKQCAPLQAALEAGCGLEQGHLVFLAASSGAHREVFGGSLIAFPSYSHIPSRNAARGKIKSQFFPQTIFPISSLNFLNLRSSK